jgi:hypothetical protein
LDAESRGGVWIVVYFSVCVGGYDAQFGDSLIENKEDCVGCEATVGWVRCWWIAVVHPPPYSMHVVVFLAEGCLKGGGFAVLSGGVAVLLFRRRFGQGWLGCHLCVCVFVVL